MSQSSEPAASSDSLGVGGHAIGMLVLLLIVAVACSTERTLDRAALERELRNQLLPEHPGLVTSVTCPELDEPSVGASFRCDAELGAQVVAVDVELGGSDDELVSTAVIAERLVATGEIAAVLSETFGDEIGITTLVDCGQPVSAVRATEAVRCEATDPSGLVRSFDVTLGDDGLLDLRIR